MLGGDTVVYGRAEDIMLALKYDIESEREFNYTDLSTDEIIDHIATFVSLLWQNHPFCEGNTRTTAVFLIKYLCSCGFSVNNDLFEHNSWYFRNALVRANYSNPMKGVSKDKSFLVMFLRNLLLGEQNELKNRKMLIGEIAHHTSTHTSEGEKTHTSTHASDESRTFAGSNVLLPKSDNIVKLVKAIGNRDQSFYGISKSTFDHLISTWLHGALQNRKCPFKNMTHRPISSLTLDEFQDIFKKYKNNLDK